MCGEGGGGGYVVCRLQWRNFHCSCITLMEFQAQLLSQRCLKKINATCELMMKGYKLTACYLQ